MTLSPTRALLLTLLFFSSVLLSAQTFGPQVVLGGSSQLAFDTFAADLDGDGDMDILAASAGDDRIVWYANDGLGNFGTQQLISNASDYPSSVHVSDLDNDGDMDVLSASVVDDKIAWYENDGSGAFGDQQIISTETDQARCVFSADLDGDGDEDVLSASWIDDKIAWYENDGFGVFGPQQVISTEVLDGRYVHAADMDGDNDMDVLSASSGDDKIAWYENLGNGAFGGQHIISTDMVNASSLEIADLDNDGDMDVIAMNDALDEVRWFDNDGNGAFFTYHVVSLEVPGPQAIHVQDMDADGDLDILTGSSDLHSIIWHENLFSGNFGAQHILTSETDEPNAIYSADFDGDGDYDVISASYEDNKIARYRNLRFDDAPTGPIEQAFCAQEEPIVSDLQATGLNIQWYDVPMGGTALASNTLLSSSATYYASQTNSGQESVNRLCVQVTVSDPNPPFVSGPDLCCPSLGECGITVVNGINILYYSAPTVSIPVSADAFSNITTDTVFYATQTVLGCESETNEVTINIGSVILGNDGDSICVMPTGLIESEFQNVSLFPNPMTDGSVLDLSALSGEFLVELYDITGRLLRSELHEGGETVSLNRGNLNAGRYLLVLRSDGHFKEIAFIIN